MLTLTLAAALAQSPAESPAAPERLAGLDDVMHALSYRHPKPCEELEALTPTPVATLLHVVAHVEMPPWAPMRAAECLQRNHAREAREDLLRWVRDPALEGLGRQTVSLLEVLPEDVAVEVGREALQGPVADRARAVIAQDARPPVAALLGTAPNGGTP